jgi:hypothetical protein
MPEGEQNTRNIVERAAGRMMGGRTAHVDSDVDVVVGGEYGRRPYSEEAEDWYERTRGKRETLDGSEFYAVSNGYLREWVCMGQCNLFIQLLQQPPLRASMETYRNDVCVLNLTELKELLDQGGYQLPAEYNGVSQAFPRDDLDPLATEVISDRMIMVGHIFAVEAFMHRWNRGAAMSHRADVRDAFLRNYHRANRWHLAAITMARRCSSSSRNRRSSRS